VKVVDGWGIDEPKTKQGIELLEGLGLRPKGERAPRVLIVLDRAEHAVWKSFRNLGERVQIVLPEELNPYDILLNDWLVFSKATLDATVARYAAKPQAGGAPPTGAPAEAASDAAEESAT
jgi:large subunit ribosomal protein L4